jgi:hypothetical protein
MSSTLSPEVDHFSTCGSVAELILAGSVVLDDVELLRECLVAADLGRECLMRAVKELRKGQQPALADLVRDLAENLPRPRRAWPRHKRWLDPRRRH